MKFKIVLTVFVSLLCLLAKSENVKEVHEQVHKEQLANHKSRIDKSVLNEMLENDIRVRESEMDSETSTLINDLLNEAKKHIGKRYVHGTHGPNTFDCSGFSSYVFKQFGYKISTGVRYQYKQGSAVKRENARKGDLIFFTSRSSGNNAGHVGIIIDVNMETGEITFIHASLKGVKISKVEGYYERRFIGIKRVIE